MEPKLDGCNCDVFYKMFRDFQKRVAETRTTVINKDDVLNLKILLNTTNSVDEFLEKL